MKPLQKGPCVAADGWLGGFLWVWMSLCVASSFAQVTNRPPTISLNQPLDGEQVPAGTHRRVSATVADPDGVVVRADFLVDGLLRWRDTNAPFEFLLGDIPPGSHTLMALAFDNLNLILRLLRDDGGVVYLNGVEVFRSNLDPSIPILFDTPASQALDDGTNYFGTSLPLDTRQLWTQEH